MSESVCTVKCASMDMHGIVLTVNSERQAFCEEGLGVLGVGPLARVDRGFRHHFEEVEE